MSLLKCESPVTSSGAVIHQYNVISSPDQVIFGKSSCAEFYKEAYTPVIYHNKYESLSPLLFFSQIFIFYFLNHAINCITVHFHRVYFIVISISNSHYFYLTLYATFQFEPFVGICSSFRVFMFQF